MATTKVIPGVIDLNQANSESGLRMPKGGAFSGTPAEGMMRNDTSQSSLSSATQTLSLIHISEPTRPY